MWYIIGLDTTFILDNLLLVIWRVMEKIWVIRKYRLWIESKYHFLSLFSLWSPTLIYFNSWMSPESQHNEITNVTTTDMEFYKFKSLQSTRLHRSKLPPHLVTFWNQMYTHLLSIDLFFQPLTFLDCIQRTRYSAKWVFIGDMDE